MMQAVGDGEVLMPHRHQGNMTSNSQPSDSSSGQSQAEASGPTTPIRKLSRNRGLVIQEQSVVEESPEGEGLPCIIEESPLCESERRAAAIRKGKRKVR